MAILQGTDRYEGKTRTAGSARANRDRNLEFDLVNTRAVCPASKQGTIGDRVALVTNYFGFKRRPDYTLYLYRVDMLPDFDNTRIKKRVFSQLRSELPAFLFDGSMLFTINAVYPPNVMETKEMTSFHQERGSEERVTVKISIRLVRDLHPTDVQYLQFFNILLRSCMDGLQLVQLGRNLFDPQSKRSVAGFPIEVMHGYSTSIRHHEHEVLLCVEPQCKILRSDNVLQQMREMSRNRMNPEAIKRALIGTVVMTVYNNNTYRIDDVNFAETPMTTFDKGGQQVTLKDYFESRYRIKITDPKQPVLLSMPKDRDRRGGRLEQVKLLPEVCRMTGLSDSQRADFKLMGALAEFMRPGPMTRLKAVADFGQRIHTTEACREALQKWEMALNLEHVTVQGRVLPVEPIVLRNQNKCFVYSQAEADWSRGTYSREFGGLWKTTPIDFWHFVYPNKNFNQVENFEKAIRQGSVGLGVRIEPPNWVEVQRDDTRSIMAAVEDCVRKRSKMIMIVLPNERTDTYNVLKKRLCCDVPVHSQVITFSKVLKKEKGYQSIATKVILQMQAKLGASPWTVKIPLKDCMFVGFDTYHASMRKGQSVGALVASIGEAHTHYFSTSAFHAVGQEMSDVISDMLDQAIGCYVAKNGSPPVKIVFYRDGVGDGQLKQVVELEVKAIKDKLKSRFGDASPRLAFIVVSKRINSRFFARQGNNVVNPMPGTVVDDVVTLPERYDFFIVPQSVRQGTVNPTSFNIVYDDLVNMNADRHQVLAFKLCHLYYNWSGTVRVPAPCQFAHKLAYLVGDNINADPHPSLKEYLFYL